MTTISRVGLIIPWTDVPAVYPVLSNKKIMLRNIPLTNGMMSVYRWNNFNSMRHFRGPQHLPLHQRPCRRYLRRRRPRRHYLARCQHHPPWSRSCPSFHPRCPCPTTRPTGLPTRNPIATANRLPRWRCPTILSAKKEKDSVTRQSMRYIYILGFDNSRDLIWYIFVQFHPWTNKISNRLWRRLNGMYWTVIKEVRQH